MVIRLQARMGLISSFFRNSGRQFIISGVYTLPVFRGPAKLLQVCFLRSSGFLALERDCWCSSGKSLSCKVLGDENLRSSGLVFTLERMCFAFVSWHSSGYLCARAGPDVCALRSSALFYARAGHAASS
ncbi:hypothetical protein CsSME_00022198 [Camellia sinensis var. sinensis]